MVEASRGWIELLPIVGGVFEDVECLLPQCDYRHAAGACAAIAAVWRPNERCSKDVAIKPDAPVQICHRDAEVMDIDEVLTVKVVAHERHGVIDT
jgi:hypothetical protein